MRYDLDELAAENAELRARTEVAERREQREFEEAEAQRRAEAEDRYSAMRLTGRAPDGSRVTERSLDEIFTRASVAADHDDEIEEMQRTIREQRGGWVEPVDASVKPWERMRHEREWIAKAAKDPKLIKQLERELERRNRDVERYLWHSPSPTRYRRENVADEYVRYGGPIVGIR
jgi:hypothetical protein